MNEKDEALIAQNEVIKILMGTIIKANLYLLKFKPDDQKLAEDHKEVLEIFNGIYDEYLDGPKKDEVISSLRQQ